MCVYDKQLGNLIPGMGLSWLWQSTHSLRVTLQNPLAQQLAVLKTVAEASGNQLVVSVLPADKTQHGSIIPVMDACALAEVDNVAFDTVM